MPHRTLLFFAIKILLLTLALIIARKEYIFNVKRRAGLKKVTKINYFYPLPLQAFILRLTRALVFACICSSFKP